MQRLILMRHGKAERGDAGGDAARGLTARGRDDVALVGRALKGQGLVPDRALVSSARRTQETWAALAEVFGETPAKTSKPLYLAPAERIADLVEDEDDAGTLIVVGHNPGLHEFALSLIGSGSSGGALRHGFPTGAAAAFLIDENGRASFDGFFRPSEYGGGGPE